MQPDLFLGRANDGLVEQADQQPITHYRMSMRAPWDLSSAHVSAWNSDRRAFNSVTWAPMVAMTFWPLRSRTSSIRVGRLVTNR